MSQKPFALLYRWKVDPAHVDEFRRRWREATIDLKDRFGALGSCLTRDEEGNFVAFARWPSREQRERANAERSARPPAPGVLAFEQMELCVEDDLLLTPGAQPEGIAGNLVDGDG